MTKDENANKPLADQIIEEMLTSIKKHSAFDNETLQKLEQLYQSGNMKRAERIIEAIKPKSEVES